MFICHENYRLRLLAESKGYRLDDTGLFPATHSSSGNRVSEKSELLIFSYWLKK